MYVQKNGSPVRFRCTYIGNRGAYVAYNRHVSVTDGYEKHTRQLSQSLNIQLFKRHKYPSSKKAGEFLQNNLIIIIFTPLMKKTILLLAWVLMSLIPAAAQVDTVFSKLNTFATGHVLNLSPAWGKMEMERIIGTKTNQLFVPMKNISSIHFADGFRLNFQDGTPVRDNLLLCPNLLTMDNKVMAEGLVRLNDNELKSLLGERTYALGIRPGSTQFTAGAWQAGIGTTWLILFGIHTIKPNVLRSYYYEGPGTPSWPLSFNYFMDGMAISGLISIVMGKAAVKNALQNRDEMVFVSEKKAKKEFWWGLAGIGAGVGIMAGGCLNWDMHCRSNDQMFPTAAVVMMLGGAILANVGVIYATHGSIYMSAHHKYKSRLNLSAAGISYRF
jgi:hypothetical protein